MAKTLTLPIPQTIKVATCQILESETETDWKLAYTVSAEGAVVTGLGCVSSDAEAKNLKIGFDPTGAGGAAIMQIGCVAIPASSGLNGTVNAVDLLNVTALPFLPLDRNEKRIMPLNGGGKLYFSAAAAMTASAVITITAFIEEY
jgi:hypothetical protein